MLSLSPLKVSYLAVTELIKVELTHASFCLGSRSPSSRILASMNNLRARSTEMRKRNCIFPNGEFQTDPFSFTFVVLYLPLRVRPWARAFIEVSWFFFKVNQVQPFFVLKRIKILFTVRSLIFKIQEIVEE